MTIRSYWFPIVLAALRIKRLRAVIECAEWAAERHNRSLTVAALKDVDMQVRCRVER